MKKKECLNSIKETLAKNAAEITGNYSKVFASIGTEI